MAARVGSICTGSPEPFDLLSTGLILLEQTGCWGTPQLSLDIIKKGWFNQKHSGLLKDSKMF